MHDVICSECPTMLLPGGGGSEKRIFCPCWLWPLIMKLVRTRDQTCVPCEFGTSSFSSSWDIWGTNKKLQTALKTELYLCVVTRATALSGLHIPHYIEYLTLQWNQKWRPTLQCLQPSSKKQVDAMSVLFDLDFTLVWWEAGAFSALTLSVGHQKCIRYVKKLSDEVMAWLSICSNVQMICIWCSWWHYRPTISCFIKIHHLLLH